MSFFHVCPTWLQPGSVIRPGNYGRIIQLTGSSHRFWEREMVLEKIRIEQFSEKPSRLQSAFVLEDIRAAEFYKKHNCSTGVLYEVEPTIDNPVWHRGDFNVIQPLPRRSENMEEIAIRYWQNSLRIEIVEEPGLVCRELLAVTSLRILREI
jgi:hypothetical protein